MAKLKRMHTVEVAMGGETVELDLRDPAPQELTDFYSGRMAAQGDVNEARREFFDRLLVGVRNLEDHDGNIIGVEKKDAIPVNWKIQAVIRLFEAQVNVKN